MRVLSRRLFATPTGAGTGKGLKPAPLALLPPLPLYRRLLRAHRRKLPQEQRLVGDEYIKAEFRRHRDVENPMHILSVLLVIGPLYHADISADWLPHRVAAVHPSHRRRFVARRLARKGQD